MKPVLSLLALVLFVGCAPSVSKPTPTTVPAASLVEMSLAVDSEPVELTREEGAWFYHGGDYSFGVALQPAEFVTVKGAEHDAYVEAGGYESISYALNLMGSGPRGFAISLANNGSTPVRVVWDDSAIVLPDGSSSRVIHVGVKYSEMNNSQPPTIVPPGARIDEVIEPTANISYTLGDWETKPLFGALEPGEKATLFLALDVAGERESLTITATGTRSHDIIARE